MIKKEEDACWHCPKRTENCHSTCKEGKIAAIKRELDRRKKKKFELEHGFTSTDALEKTIQKNIKKYNKHGLRRKG
jgi:hypothetical protein